MQADKAQHTAQPALAFTMQGLHQLQSSVVRGRDHSVALDLEANTNTTNTVGLKPSSPALASEQICSWGFAQSVGTCPLRIRLGDRNHPHKYVNSSTR
jgi:hypothetical protein